MYFFGDAIRWDNRERKREEDYVNLYNFNVFLQHTILKGQTGNKSTQGMRNEERERK